MCFTEQVSVGALVNSTSVLCEVLCSYAQDSSKQKLTFELVGEWTFVTQTSVPGAFRDRLRRAQCSKRERGGEAW